MSDALRKLIEAVEAGDLSATNNSLGVMYSELGNHWPWDSLNKVNSAFRGSLDAAVALCEVLLPGWMPELRKWPDGLCVATIRPPYAPAHQAHGPTLARALLLAVLRAKLTEMEDE